MELIIAPDRRTDRLGGTDIPDIDALQKMHATQYILHPALERFGKIPSGFKNLFVMESDARGLSWTPPRMVCTVYGQTCGYPAAQSDGTVAVIHDTRYGPGAPGSRAMISRDEGRTWEDEVYYMDVSAFTGSYSASVMMEDDTILSILSICGSSKGASWDQVRDATDLYAVRWRPEPG